MSLFTTTSAYAKDQWLPGFNNQLENAKGTLLGLLPKSAMDAYKIEGRQSFMKLQVGDSLGQGTIAEGGDFPDAGDIASDEATITAAHLAHTINWTSEEMVYLDSLTAAAAPIMRKKMSAALEAMQRDIQRQAWMDGTGVLSLVASEVGSTVTIDATDATQRERDRYIWLDDANRRRYMIVDPTDGSNELTVATDFTITNIAEATNVLTLSVDAGGAADGDYIVHSGNWAAAGAFRSLEFAGIQAMVADDNTYLGIDRTATGKGYWQSIVVDNSGTLRPVTENLVHTLFNRMARRRTDGKQPRGDDYCAFANSGSWTAYHNLLSPGLRYTLGETPDIGWGQPLNFRGVKLYEDIHCPKNGYFVLHKPSIGFVKPKHLGNLSGSLTKFMERGGSIFFQGNAAVGQGHSAQVFSYLEGFLGMATDRPRNHGWLKDITEVAI